MTGDEIVIAGRRFHTGTRIVLWSEPGGFNGYDTHGVQMFAERDRVRPWLWDLKMLQETIDQFVIHYDASGSSKRCFEVLQQRALSVHFMLDVDGTISQTLDIKERAWHATKANSRSVGIEIANLGAFPADDSAALEAWYREHPVHPLRSEPVIGPVQGQMLRMYDLTPQQYEALIKLTAALRRALPRITCDYPRDSSGQLIDHVLTDPQFQSHHGLIGHYHVQLDKIDPGPAFQWDRVIDSARKLL